MGPGGEPGLARWGARRLARAGWGRPGPGGPGGAALSRGWAGAGGGLGPRSPVPCLTPSGIGKSRGVRPLLGDERVPGRTPVPSEAQLSTAREAPRRPHGGPEQPLTQGATPAAPREEGTFQNRCGAARPPCWLRVPGTAGLAGAGLRSSPPAARSLRGAADQPLSSGARGAVGRERPEHCSGAAIPALRGQARGLPRPRLCGVGSPSGLRGLRPATCRPHAT